MSRPKRGTPGHFAEPAAFHVPAVHTRENAKPYARITQIQRCANAAHDSGGAAQIQALNARDRRKLREIAIRRGAGNRGKVQQRYLPVCHGLGEGNPSPRRPAIRETAPSLRGVTHQMEQMLQHATLASGRSIPTDCCRDVSRLAHFLCFFAHFQVCVLRGDYSCCHVHVVPDSH